MPNLHLLRSVAWTPFRKGINETANGYIDCLLTVPLCPLDIQLRLLKIMHVLYRLLEKSWAS